MLRDTTPLTIEAKAQVYSFSNEEKARREQCIKQKDYFYDRAKQYLNLLNSDVDPVVVNVTAPIIKKKISLLYSRPLKRDYDGPAGSVSFIKTLYDKIKIDRFLRNVDLAAELTGTGLIFAGIDEDSKETYLRLYDASDFSIVPKDDNQEEIDALSIVSVKMRISGDKKNPTVEKYLDTQIWTDKYVTEYRSGMRHRQSINELGFLPFCAFKGEDIYGQFLGHAPAMSIVLLNEDMNQQITNISYMIKMQSGTPIVIKGFERGEGIVVHPGKAISLPAGAEAQALQLNPKIMDSLSVIQWLEIKLYETSSVPKVSIIGDAEAKSGRELMIKWAPLVQVFKEKASRYENYELNLANMILQINDMPLLQSMKVMYPEERVLPLGDDAIEIEGNMRIGLTTPIDELMKRNPILTEEEAEAEVRANIGFNKSVEPVDNKGIDSQKVGLDAGR